MQVPSETPCVSTPSLRSGHFRERGRYAVWRSRGTVSWLLVFTVAGAGRFGFDAGEITTGPGQLVLLRPHVLHDYGVENQLRRWELLWAHFHPRTHWLTWLNWPEEAPGLMRLDTTDAVQKRAISKAFCNVTRLASSGIQRREDLAMHALEHILLCCDTVNPSSDVKPIDPRIQASVDFIQRYLATPLPLTAVADAAGLSVSRLAHLFREQIGSSPQRFIEGRRIDQARQSLEFTSRSVGSIAREVGFENAFYFSLRFKRQTGLSPRDYRRHFDVDRA